MAEHEPSIGKSDDWYTPPWIFPRIGLEFDLDPCSPGPNHWVPARKVYTESDDGLQLPWFGLVFMNPPFGGRRGHVPWLKKFINHANGIAIVRAYTSADWFQEYIPQIETILFPTGKTKFIHKDKGEGTSPGHGVVLLGMGARSNQALRTSNLGIYFPLAAATLPIKQHLALGDLDL